MRLITGATLFILPSLVGVGCALEQSIVAQQGGDASAGTDVDTDTETSTVSGDSGVAPPGDAGPLFDAPATCEEALARKSNIGCEYWAADLDNAENSIGSITLDNAAAGIFAVAVANMGRGEDARVEVHVNNAAQGEPLDLESVDERIIESQTLEVFYLPRRDVDGEPVTLGVDDGPQTWLSSRAFRITSTIPVVAYQFNTFNQRSSNDASLLLPTSGLGRDHLVVSYPPSTPIAAPLSPRNRGYVTVLGVEPNTTVEVVPTARIMAGEGVDEISPNQLVHFTIGPFDVLNLETALLSSITMKLPDLTGTIVRSDKPVAVFTGSDMSFISSPAEPQDPEDNECCADHIEQQVLPSEAMGRQFVVPHSAKRGYETTEDDYYRIMAYSDETTVKTNLPAPDDVFELQHGEYHEFFTDRGFIVDSSGPLHVAQFLVIGSDTETGRGDPALLYVPSIDQRRSVYLFTTGKGFSHNYAVISMRRGTRAYIDDTEVEFICAGPDDDGQLGDKIYESWTCDVEAGAHLVYSEGIAQGGTSPIGVFVYGYYNAGSYAYPAGSDLRLVNPDVVY